MRDKSKTILLLDFFKDISQLNFVNHIEKTINLEYSFIKPGRHICFTLLKP